MGWVSGNEYEWFMTKNRAIGPYWWTILDADPVQRGSSLSFYGSAASA